MATLFTELPFEEVVAGLGDIGYSPELLKENYTFTDWFSSKKEVRQIDAVAFGQKPISYDSACIGVARTNGFREEALINRLRALAAPIILEVDNYEVREWAVSRHENKHVKVGSWPTDLIRQMIERRAPAWRPQPLLRSKNIGSFEGESQLSLFAGLLPELEEHIQSQLEPLLRAALSTTKAVYRDLNGNDPNPTALFKLIFWVLTAKVFHDRHVPGFIKLESDPDAILGAVAKQYDAPLPYLLNKKAREVAVASIWSTLDFHHLSVEVLAEMWSTMLVDEDIKKRYGIHRTPRTIVRYIVERVLPLEPSGDDQRIIFEPCSGSASFLIGAMNYLRPNLFLMSQAERDRFFRNHLAGIEKEDFGVEISHLALALSDFPNLSGWTQNVVQGDVFEPDVMTANLCRASAVLCNPPFQKFKPDEKEQYEVSSAWKPVELLNRVLDGLHKGGVLGFVLPRNIVDGRGGYADIRKRLAKRFAKIELTILPDKAFPDADTEVGLLIAKEPIPHDRCQIAFSKVYDDEKEWRRFELRHEVSTKLTANQTVEEASETFAVYELSNVWDHLINYPTLGEVAKVHRGLEWNESLTENGKETGKRSKFERNKWEEGFMLGVASRTKFDVFEKPRLSFLNVRPQHQKGNAYKLPWDKPKAILNKSTRSRGRWRMAAFPDSEGVTCYQTFIGVWPISDKYDEWLLSAILNSPVANAFVATREGKTDNTLETIRTIPVPHFTESQREKLRSLIKQYQNAAFPPIMTNVAVDPARLLMEIDALVLDGYRMPPRIERELLDFFCGKGDERVTPHGFGNYFPPEFEVFLSLSDYLSPNFAAASATELMQRLKAS